MTLGSPNLDLGFSFIFRIVLDALGPLNTTLGPLRFTLTRLDPPRHLIAYTHSL